MCYNVFLSGPLDQNTYNRFFLKSDSLGKRTFFQYLLPSIFIIIKGNFIVNLLQYMVLLNIILKIILCLYINIIPAFPLIYLLISNLKEIILSCLGKICNFSNFHMVSLKFHFLKGIV